MEQMLTSVQNTLVRQMAGLKEKKGRDATGHFLVEGIRFVEEALQAEVEIIQVFYSPKLLESERGKLLLDKLHQQKTSVILVSPKVLAFVADTETPQGVVAAVRKPRTSLRDLCTDNPLLLVVDGVQDPGNLGTIVRTALATGTTGIICTKGTVDLYNPKTLRSTMGAIFNLPSVQGVTGEEVADWLAESNIPMLVADVRGTEVYYQARIRPPLAIVIGNEGQGPSQTLLDRASQKVRIPLQNGVESLNAAVAAALFLFESARQRKRD